MYLWRRMTDEQRQTALRERQTHGRPWHGPPHFRADTSLFLITAACFDHQSHIGTTPARMAEFEAELLAEFQPHCQQIHCWVVLPNHYHVLVQTHSLDELLAATGRLHGRTSHRWNGEDKRRGRQVWHRAAETAMKSERHFWATVNYVLHNPVRHGYVKKWLDWPYSSAADYIASMGRERAEAIWREYPLYEYGADWDPPEL